MRLSCVKFRRFVKCTSACVGFSGSRSATSPPDLGTQTSPKVSVEHVHPTLNGHGPVWTGKLPELQEFVDLRAQERNDSSAASPPATRPDSPCIILQPL